MTRDSEKPLLPVLSIRFPGEDKLGRGKMQLLDNIRRTGSISAAGRAMDMSYRRAWLLVSELNGMFAEISVESQRGGQNGGGAVVTPFGEELLARFRRMESLVDTALADDLAWLQAKRGTDGPDDPSIS